MLGLTFSSELDWGSYIIFITENAYKKTGPFSSSMKLLSTEVALYLYKYTTQRCMEYCHHVHYLELLDKLQKQICRIVGP